MHTLDDSLPLETFTRQTDRQTKGIRERRRLCGGHKIINLKTILFFAFEKKMGWSA
jgi:hypothetical protein